MCDELAVLNPYDGFEVETPHDRREIQIVYLAELARPQPMVAIVSGSVVLSAKRHDG
jgi:hypothetical protein